MDPCLVKYENIYQHCFRVGASYFETPLCCCAYLKGFTMTFCDFTVILLVHHPGVAPLWSSFADSFRGFAGKKYRSMTFGGFLEPASTAKREEITQLGVIQICNPVLTSTVPATVLLEGMKKIRRVDELRHFENISCIPTGLSC